MTSLTNHRSLFWSIVTTGTWLVVWFAPWQALLSFSMWLQLGIALVVFVVPGLCIYGLIQTGSSGWLSHLTFGFVISHLLLAALGTLGRLFHFSFSTLKHGMLGISLILLLIYALPKLASFRRPRFERATFLNILSSWPVIVTMLLASLLTIQRTLSDDDLSYLAYLTNWQHASALNFKDVFFGADQLASVRFWIVSTPFSQGYLSEISGLPGIFVLGGTYEPLLAALSICCLYELARALGLSRRKAMAAGMFQVIFLALLSEYLHPGAPFLRQLSTDKATAAYIFFPVFLQSVLQYLENPDKKKISLVILTGSSLMFMHPVMLVFAVAVAGLITLFGLKQTDLRMRTGFLLILLAIMTPQIAIRFIKHEAQASIPYSMDAILSSSGIETMVTVWNGTNFYGFNPSILSMRIPYDEWLPKFPLLMEYGWLIIPLLGAALALKSFRHDQLSQYILACFLLGAAAGIPFTGWLLGYLVSAWMLERTLWIYPFGIVTVFVLTELTSRLPLWLQTLQPQVKIDPRPWLFSVLTVCSALFLWLVMRDQGLPNLTRLDANTKRYTAFVQIGKFIDKNIQNQAYVMGTDDLNDYIPGISSKGKAIVFRPSDPSYPYFYTLEERNQRLLDRQVIFSREAASSERVTLIQKYNIRFLWLKSGEYSQVKNLLSDFPALFIEHHLGGYYLIEVHP